MKLKTASELFQRFVKTAAILLFAFGIIMMALAPIKTLGANADQLDQVFEPPIVRYTGGSTLTPSVPTGGYNPAQIRKAYGIDQLSSVGTGVTIAIIDAYADPTIQSDLNFFDTTYNLPSITITIQQTWPGGVPPVNIQWASEIALDVEWVHAIAPGANILLVEALSNSGTDLLAAIDYATSHGANVVSMSWGGSETSGSSSLDTHFNHAGITYLASTGDNGAQVQWPAVSPYVVAVGGTTLTTLADGTYVSEAGWSGSGGGTSAYISRPSYQTGFQTAANRGVPDVSFDADPASGVAVYNTTGSSGWGQWGGTSLSAPCWAGLLAVLGQSGPTWLYSQAAPSSAYAANYHDVTSGNNGLPAGTGYDLVTGLGSPIAAGLAGLSIFTSSLLPSGDIGVSYSNTLTATGGTAPYTWSLISGTLPDGLSLNPATGAITGTPTTSGGPTQITFQVTDSIGATASKPVSITINVQPSITTASPLPGGELTVAYSQTPVVTGGSLPFTWSVSAGTLPAGLSLNTSTGAITGTPTSVSNPTFTIMVTDSAGGTGTKVFTLNFIAGPTISTTSPLPGGEVTAAYSSTLTGAGGSGVYTSWAVSSGSLPAGLTLHATTGVIDGTPTSVSNPSFTIRVTDSAGGTGTKTFTLRIIAAPSITTTSPLTGGEVTAPYNKTVVASGGSGTFTNWIVSVGSLPAGLTLNSGTGVISGTPTTVSNPSFTIRVTDSAGGYGTKAFTLNIVAAPRITSSAPPSGWDQNLLFTPYTVTGSGGTGTRTFSASGLPAGLSLNSSTGVISGTPTTVNNYSTCVITVTDGIGGTGTQNAPMNIVAKPGITSLAPPASWDQNLLFTSYNVIGAGGTGTRIFSAAGLPVGLTINSSTGVIAGTPTTVNNYTSCVITVTDAIGGTGTQNAPMNIVAKPGITSAAPPAAWDQNLLFTSFTVTATGGTGARIFSASGLPTGLAINSSTGVISGTPTALGSFNSGIVTVTDSIGGAGTQAFSIIINPLPSITATSPLANGKIGVVYLQTLGVSGGTSPFTWSITAGALPTGLTLNSSSGAITGTPTTTVVSSNITFRVVDSVGGSVSKILAITVKSASVADFDGDGKTDLSIYASSNGNWYIRPSSTGVGYIQNWGLTGTTIVPGDYDGDGKTDLALFDPVSGNWYINPSSTGVGYIQNWGITGAIPVPGDYDGDGKTDLALYVASIGNWYINPSSTGVGYIKNWGIAGATAVPGDYDGDGKTDLALFDPVSGNWYINPSSTGVGYIQNWGISGAIPVPGDYDGDGKTDLALYVASTGNWYIRPSSTGVGYIKNWGIAGATAVPGDYDGDGKTDLALFDPVSGNWYINPSSTGVGYIQNWGITGAIPVP